MTVETAEERTGSIGNGKEKIRLKRRYHLGLSIINY